MTPETNSPPNLCGASADPRDEFIGRVVRGQTFADVGGLWGIVNEKVSVAVKQGASEVAMCDITPFDSHLWSDFDARMLKLAVSDVNRFSGDIQKLAAAPSAPHFDVVHCSGILYHLPNPLGLFIALRKVTRRYLILSTSVVPTRIQNEVGILELPESSALFVPGLSGRELEIVRAHWLPQVGNGAVGLTTAVAKWDPDDFSPWWWLPTVACARGMAESVGFACRDDAPSWGGFAHTFLLETC